MFSLQIQWRRPAGVGLMSLNPPVVFKYDCHIYISREKVRGGLFSKFMVLVLVLGSSTGCPHFFKI